MRRGMLVLVTLCALAAACTPVQVDVTLPDPNAMPVAVTRLRSEPYSLTTNSGITDARRMVVRDPATWASVWAEIWSHHGTVPDRPVVDFDRELVVVAALGQRMSGGHSIIVKSAAVSRGELVVRIATTQPGPACGTTAALTEPLDAARVPRFTGTVRFVDEPLVRDCR